MEKTQEQPKINESEGFCWNCGKPIEMKVYYKRYCNDKCRFEFHKRARKAGEEKIRLDTLSKRAVKEQSDTEAIGDAA